MENQSASKTREGDNDDEDDVVSSSDRISQLPEPVLHHILRFLSQKEALRTCVLSKTWRHLGPTRPVIDLRGLCEWSHMLRIRFCENCFYGNNEAFISVLEKTFQRYHHQNLSPQVLHLQMLEVDSESISVLQKWISSFMKPNTSVSTFRLSVCDYKNDPYSFLDLPSAVFKAESLQDLYLHRCKITSVENVVLQNLKKLSLKKFYIDDDSLQKIISGSPSVEYVKLRYGKGLKTISFTNESQNLKDIKFVGCTELNFIEIDAPTLQSIHIELCLKWKLNRNNYFPHLKSLHLIRVHLSPESENFSCNFPLLENFKLDHCGGFEEIKLFCPLLKHLTIDQLDSSVKFDIFAPNILCFKFSGGFFPSTISFTTASREWKSKITLKNTGFVYNDALPRFLELNEMFKAVSQSQVSLDISELIFHESQQIECGIHDPIVVENLEISDYLSVSVFNSIPSLFYALFQICRPKCVTTRYGCTSSRHSNGVAKCIWKILIQEREYNDYWQQHLEEVSVKAYDFEERVWHHGKCFHECAPNHGRIHFGLKWRD